MWIRKFIIQYQRLSHKDEKLYYKKIMKRFFKYIYFLIKISRHFLLGSHYYET